MILTTNNLTLIKKIFKFHNIEQFCGKLKYLKTIKLINYGSGSSHGVQIYNDHTIVELVDYSKFNDTDFINEKLKLLYDLFSNNLFSNNLIAKINIIFLFTILYNNKKINLVPILISKYSFSDNDFNKKINDNIYLINKNEYVIDNSWISASKIRNYLLEDPLIDYLEYNRLYEIDDLIKFERKNKEPNDKEPDDKGPDDKEPDDKEPDYKGPDDKEPDNKEPDNKKSKKTNKRKFSEINNDNILFNNGNQFELNIVNKLKENFSNDIITIINSSNYCRETFNHIIDPIFFELTKKAINNNIPIIYQGVLHDIESKTYGVPDLIVRGDYIHKIFKQSVDINYLHNDQYLYYIIDIKNSNINLSALSNNVLNNISVKPFKGQIAIYHQILSKIQNYDTKKGFILANKWTRKQKDNIYTCTNPFDCVGIIDFATSDIKYISDSNDAIKWLHTVRTDKSLLCIDPTNDNLYPNMKNQMDNKFKKIKTFLADRNHEITSIWNCGIKNRKNAFKHKIKKWSHPKLNSNILSIGGKNGILIDKMLNINRSNKDLIMPKKIKSKYNNWRNINDLSFYLDFETINKVAFELKEWEEMEINQFNGNDLIFMIGIGYSINNIWSYKSFIVEDLSDNNQIDIINKMFNFIKQICGENRVYEPNIYHWSNFEPLILTKSCTKHKLILPMYKWIDILKLFHDEPILVKGALNFSLKSIGKAMYEHKMIDTYWDDSNCTNGLDAMHQAYTIYLNENKDDSITQNMQMKIINKYNEIDCKIMWNILNYLRENH